MLVAETAYVAVGVGLKAERAARRCGGRGLRVDGLKGPGSSLFFGAGVAAGAQSPRARCLGAVGYVRGVDRRLIGIWNVELH